jgi:uncharacterized protein YegJ (DUF2314 family)
MVACGACGACGKSDKQGTPSAAPATVEGSATPAAQPPAAATPAAPTEPPAAPAAGSGSGSDDSKDKAVAATSKSEVDALEKAIAPYVEQAQRTFPDAKKRFLAGLPTGHKFAVLTKLKASGKVETVFVLVKKIEGGKITGTINSEVRAITGFKAGDSYTLPEGSMIDWVIVSPDGREEGNAVGKFLDTWQAQQHH